jgi:hypothetical protein
MTPIKMHSRTIGHVAFAGIVALCVCGGCWEVIEYAGPPASTAPGPDATTATNEEAIAEPVNESAQSPPAAGNDSSAESFGDELADSTPLEEDSPSIAAPSDDRYSTSNEGRDDQPDAERPAAAAADDTSLAAPAANTRLAAWLLGSKLSLAALAHDRGVAADKIPTWFGEARAAAESLETSVPELPERSATSDDAPASREVLGYLLDQGKRVGPELATRFGADHAALFEVSLKSNLLLVLYKPGSSAVEHISAAIDGAAPRAALPPELWRPLLDTLANGAPAVDVRAAVRRLHTDAERHLATAVEP